MADEGSMAPTGESGTTTSTSTMVEAVVAGTNWDGFRYMGDFLHLLGIVIIVTHILQAKSVAGYSKKTQLLYLLVYCTRYLDLLEDFRQPAYLKIFKVTYILTAMITYSAFNRFASTYQQSRDTCQIWYMVVPCTLMAMTMTEELTLLETTWTFSEYIEAVAMVPQYIFCYRDQVVHKRLGVLMFVLMFGGYRICYCLHWMYKKYSIGRNYSDVNSWVAGILEVVLFADFLAFEMGERSYLRRCVLAIDLKVHEVHEAVESRFLGGECTSFENADSGELRRRQRVVDPDCIV